MDFSETHMMNSLCSAILFALVGMVVLVSFFMIFDKLTPGNLWKQVITEKNQAVAIFMGAFIIALAMIISSAIKG